MNVLFRVVLATAAAAACAESMAEVTFFEQEGFRGRSFTTDRPVENLERFGFNDRATSVVVAGEPWEVCDDARFGGRCVMLRPGEYSSLAAMGLNNRVSSTRAAPASSRRDARGYAPAPGAPQVTFFERESFRGRSFTTDRPVENFRSSGFDDFASSVEVVGDSWEICDDARYVGRCVVLRPGRYPSLPALGLGNRFASTRAVPILSPDDVVRAGPAAVAAQIIFYEHEGFAGRSFTVDKPIDNFASYGFNDLASSVVVVGESWQICDDARFGGRCIVLRPGRYPSMNPMGLNDRVSSARTVGDNARPDDNRYAPASMPAYNFRRRDNERLYEANVTSVRAVVGSPEQRCWVEREQLSQPGGSANVPGAIAGAIVGGILGHQIGSGRGRDLATAGGAVAGAAVGANVGRDRVEQQGNYQEVQRCKSVPSQAQAELWDVTYDFRGTEHRIQMTSDPGRTVTVNERGEPRE